jgi:hypothetical protein
MLLNPLTFCFGNLQNSDICLLNTKDSLIPLKPYRRTTNPNIWIFEDLSLPVSSSSSSNRCIQPVLAPRFLRPSTFSDTPLWPMDPSRSSRIPASDQQAGQEEQELSEAEVAQVRDFFSYIIQFWQKVRRRSRPLLQWSFHIPSSASVRFYPIVYPPSLHAKHLLTSPLAVGMEGLTEVSAFYSRFPYGRR